MNQILPVILLKGLVLLPNQEVRLELNNEISFNVINLSIKEYNDLVLIVCPKDQYEESPEVSDLPVVGVIGKIKSKIELPNGGVRVVITGLKRVAINKYLNDENDKDILEADVTEIILPKFDEVEESALRRKLLEVLEEYIKNNPTVSDSLLNPIRNISDLYRLTDIITAFVPFTVEKKLAYMEEINALYRARELIRDLNIELQIIELETKIDDTLRDEFENNQKEFILRERLEQIKKELGEGFEKEDIAGQYLEKLNDLKLPEKTYKKLLNEIKKFDYTNESSPELSLLRNYLDLVLSLPWNKLSKDEVNLKRVKSKLDETHYGLESVKTRVIEYIAVKIRNKEINSPILCLVGPPGVGKTSFSMGVAKALNKEFYKISVGGLNDSAELNGHRRTYIGAAPGKIIQALSKCETRNPLILIDEVDKLVKDYKGDPASALLEILDPQQNMMFVDNYVEEPFDLSKVMFILTANDINGISEVLRDRLEIIELSSYTEFDKLDIAKQHLIPKIYNDHLLKSKDMKISDEIITELIKRYTKEAGVRELERQLNALVRKNITASMLEGKSLKKTITKKDVKEFLGNEKYDDTITIVSRKPGLVNGLAYTSTGGQVMPIESCFYEGNGALEITGMLGDVMKESVKVALSYIKENKDDFKIKEKFFDKKNIHIHFLEGAIPKDGPSAGCAIVTSILSLILNKIIPLDIAMTGEVSLRGDVLKIGGLKEKIIGGYNNGVTTFIIPYTNRLDVDEIPKKVLDDINIIYVKNYQEIFDYIFSN